MSVATDFWKAKLVDYKQLLDEQLLDEVFRDIQN